MPRIDIELTSNRDDGSWTWRAAGAREPRGTVDGSLLPAEASVGDVLRVETEQYMEGTTVTAVLPSKRKESPSDLLPLFDSPSRESGVTTQLASGRRRRNDSSKHPTKKTRGRHPETKAPPEKKPKKNTRGTRKRSSGVAARNTDKVSQTLSSKAPRLRPRRKHREKALRSLPENQQLLGRILLKGGIPAVRETIAQQNEQATTRGEPEIPSHILLTLAENIKPNLQTAEWQDRAEAAEAGMDDLDLRDLRSVVVAAESGARNQESRELADRLRLALTARVEREHESWIEELQQTLTEGRTVRALRLSSRPPKAGAPMPSELLERLEIAASESLTAETNGDRWRTLLDAIANSPVHGRVSPSSVPKSPNKQLLSLVTRLSKRIPRIAAEFDLKTSTSLTSKGQPKHPPPS